MDDRPPDLDDLPEELIQLVKPELLPGERLIWAARAQLPPISSGLTSIQRLAILAVGLVGAGSVGLAATLRGVEPNYWTAIQAFIGVGSFLALIIGMPLGLIVTTSAVHGALLRRVRARACYALTDRRAILWVPERDTEAFTIQTIPAGSVRPESVRRVQYPDGSGNVSFPEPIPTGLPRPTGFIGVADARRVEDLVRRFLAGVGPESTT